MISLSHIKSLSLSVLILLLFLVIPVSTYAQRNFKKESIEKYKQDKDYNYFKKKQVQPEEEIEEEHTPSSFNIGPGIRVILIILLVLIIGFIVYSIVKGNKDYRNYDNKNINDQIIDNILDEEQIEENDFDALLKLALSKEEYRSALRIMFLKSLQILNKKEVIIYQKNKTNYEYLSEINKQKLKPVFQKASDSFSWVWYANTSESIDKETFLILEPHFNALLKEVE